MAEGSRFTPFNPVAAYNRGVDRARADRAYEAEQRRNAFLSEAFKKYTNPMTGEVDRNALLGAASQAGYGLESLGLTKQFQEIEEGEQKNVKAREENFASRLENRKALLPLMADSQEGWETWIDQTVRDVPELAPYQNMVDRTYSPQAVEKAMMNLEQVLQATYTLANMGNRTEVLRTRPFGTRPPESVMTLNMGIDPNEASRAARAATAQPRIKEVVGPDGRVMLVYADQYRIGDTFGDQSVIGESPRQTPYGQAAAKGLAESDLNVFTAAENAASSLQKDYQTLDLLDAGKASTGITADLAQFRDRLLSVFDGDSKAAERASDTELLNSLLGSDVFANIQALGIGARGLDTPAEREFLRDVVSGRVQLNEKTLRRMAEIRANVKVRIIERYNQRVESGALDRLFTSVGRTPQKIEIPQRTPSTAAPSGSWSIRRRD
ncbi:MAG: hypothetical protein VKK05_03625 [Synechococcus sp.]|nr:hypothetical protein [Synechococcus sp.]